MQLEHGAVPEHALGPLAAQDEPRPAGAAPSGRRDRPPARHAQVGAQDDPALETQEQVLAVGRHRLEDPAVDPLGDPLRLRARVRRLGRDAFADQHLQASRGTVDRVPFGHGATVTAGTVVA